MVNEPAKCNHIKLDGAKCGANALNDKQYCYYHLCYHEPGNVPADTAPCEVPVFEDTRSILFGIHQTLRAFLSGQLDSRKCGLALYGYQVAASVMPRTDARSPLEQARLEALAQAEAASKNRAASLPEKAPNLEAEFSLSQLLLDTLDKYDRGELKRNY